jgi:hypothetical protein
VICVCNPSYARGISRRISVQDLKILKAKKSWGLAEVVEHLPSNQKAPELKNK